MFKRLILTVAAIAIVPLGHAAEDLQSRQLRALPSLLDQRNNAMDSLAVCSGDLAEAHRQLAEARKQIEELLAAPKP